jgi:fatty acid CoA ligase FadD9
VPGYYKNERATKDLFDADGFMNTGDIVEQRGPDTLVWIDRAKNVLKLSQGEFVATSRLEGLYASRSPFIRQIFVYGSGLHSYLLAVVVPDIEAAMTHLRSHGSTASDEDLKQLIRTEIQRIATEEQLHGYEVPRDFLITREPFTMENGLLTGSAKPSRPKLRARYGERLEALYGDIERAQFEELYGLHGDLSEQSVAEKVKKAMEATLGLGGIDVKQQEQSFIQLGGDSLSAVGLETLIEDICGVRVPVGFMLDRTSSVRAVVDYVEKALAGASRNVSFEDVHGENAKVVRASDLRIDAFLSPAEMEAASHAVPASELPAKAEVALLTGANGFLGRFLVLDLLERLAGARKVYAIVRAPTDDAALHRLADSFRTDPALEKRLEELSNGGHLVALAGDLMKPRLGLADDVYARLTGEVDLVVHNGALVNHAFDYRPQRAHLQIPGRSARARHPPPAKPALVLRARSLAVGRRVGTDRGWATVSTTQQRALRLESERERNCVAANSLAFIRAGERKVACTAHVVSNDLRLRGHRAKRCVAPIEPFQEVDHDLCRCPSRDDPVS